MTKGEDLKATTAGGFRELRNPRTRDPDMKDRREDEPSSFRDARKPAKKKE